MPTARSLVPQPALFLLGIALAGWGVATGCGVRVRAQAIPTPLAQPTPDKTMDAVIRGLVTVVLPTPTRSAPAPTAIPRSTLAIPRPTALGQPTTPPTATLSPIPSADSPPTRLATPTAAPPTAVPPPVELATPVARSPVSATATGENPTPRPAVPPPETRSDEKPTPGRAAIPLTPASSPGPRVRNQ